MSAFTLFIFIQNDEELASFLLRDDLHLVSKLIITNVTVNNLEFLSKCTHLKNLSLSILPYVTNIEELPNSLEELDIRFIGISNMDFLLSCSMLKKLTLHWLDGVKIINNLPDSVEELNIWPPYGTNVNLLRGLHGLNLFKYTMN